MASLASVFEFSQMMGTTPSNEEKARIGRDLELATSLVERHTMRSLTSATRDEWIDQEANGVSSDRHIVRVREYPVTRIYFVGVPRKVATLKATGTAVATAEATSTGLSLFSVANGVETDTALLWASYSTLQTLAAAVAAPWALTVETDFLTLPPRFLKAGQFSGGADGIDLEGATDGRVSARVTYQGLEELTLSSCVDEVFVRYKAGYTPSTDNGDHTAVAQQGDVPLDLVGVVCSLASDVRSYLAGLQTSEQSGVPTGLLQSESIAYYSYTKATDATGMAYFNGIIQTKYQAVLDRYVRRSF